MDCVIDWLDQQEVGELRPSQEFLHNRKRSIWASRVAVCFAQPTTARPGRRSLTAKYRSARPDLLPSLIQIQTSFISAPDQTACAATSLQAAVCINRSTAERRGSLLVFTMPDRSAQYAFIRLIRTSFGFRRA